MTIVENLHNKKVITKDEIEVGTISLAVMDDQWRITHLHLTLNQKTAHELAHVKGHFKEVIHKPGHIELQEQVTLCLPVNIIEKRNDALYLTKTLEELEILPECKTH